MRFSVMRILPWPPVYEIPKIDRVNITSIERNSGIGSWEGSSLSSTRNERKVSTGRRSLSSTRMWPFDKYPDRRWVVLILELVNVTSVGSAYGRPTGRASVRMDNVNPEAKVAGVSSSVAARSPRETHRGLATAIMEQLDVGAAKVSIGHAV